MSTQFPNDIDILDFEIGGQKVRDMSGISFVGWMSSRLSGIKAFTADAVELTGYLKAPMIGKMPNESKIHIVRTMERLNIEIK